MARINAAMAASVARQSNFLRRGVGSEVSSVKNSFSSWDNCMNASYCKWPVIAICIVGGLILLSIIWCIVRCACCGLSCCCTCFSCLKCCGDCCGCCTKPEDRKHKHLDEPYAPPAAPNNRGYQPQRQTMGYTNPSTEPPKFAQFEVGKSGFAVEPPKPVNDDALPPMPSWDGAAKKRITGDEEAMRAKEEGVELGQLNHAGQSMSLINEQSPAASPLDGHPGMAQGGYMAGGQLQSPVDQFGRGQNGGNSPVDQYGRGFGGPGRVQSFNNGYGQYPQGQFPPNGGFAGAGRGPPQRQYSGDPNRNSGPGGPGRQYLGPGGPGGPGRQMTNSPGPNGFGPPGRQLTASPANGYGPPRNMNNSPGPNGFGPPPRSLTGGSAQNFGPQQRQMTNDSMSGNGGPRRSYAPPGPQRSYTGDSYRNMPPVSPSSPLNNDAGNFSYPPQQTSYATPNFSRPSPPVQQGSFGGSPPIHPLRSPPPQLIAGGYRGMSPAPVRGPSPGQYQAMPASMSSLSPEERRASGGVAYPGYKSYSPAPQLLEAQEEERDRIPNALMPGGR